MTDSSVITVKVPKELKRRMKEVEEINWSDYIRKSIVSKVEENNIRKASAKLDKIRSKSKAVPTDELVSWIREDRDKR